VLQRVAAPICEFHGCYMWRVLRALPYVVSHIPMRYVLQNVAVCCRALQRDAVKCGVLQCVAGWYPAVPCHTYECIKSLTKS